MTRRWMLVILLVSLIFVSMAQDVDNNEEDSSDEYPERYEFMNEIKAKCRNRTGSHETFKKFNEIHSVDVCLSSKLDVYNFLNDLNALVESHRAEFASKYCLRLHDVISCYETKASELRKCLNLEELAVLDGIVSLLPEGLQLACKDDGLIFFKEATGLECLGDFLRFTERCSDTISNLAEAMDPANYGPKHCDELVEFRKCFKQQIITCKAPSLMEMFDLFYQPVLRAGLCKDHTKLDKSPQLESNAF